MKKRILIIAILVFMICGIFVGCGGPAIESSVSGIVPSSDTAVANDFQPIKYLPYETEYRALADVVQQFHNVGYEDIKIHEQKPNYQDVNAIDAISFQLGKESVSVYQYSNHEAAQQAVKDYPMFKAIQYPDAYYGRTEEQKEPVMGSFVLYTPSVSAFFVFKGIISTEATMPMGEGGSTSQYQVFSLSVLSAKLSRETNIADTLKPLDKSDERTYIDMTVKFTNDSSQPVSMDHRIPATIAYKNQRYPTVIFCETPQGIKSGKETIVGPKESVIAHYISKIPAYIGDSPYPLTAILQTDDSLSLANLREVME